MQMELVLLLLICVVLWLISNCTFYWTSVISFISYSSFIYRFVKQATEYVELYVCKHLKASVRPKYAHSV